MAVKLRNTAGDASVNLIDGGAIGSPTIDLDVRTLTDLNPAGRRWDANSEYKVGDLVTKSHLFGGGFELDEYFVAQVDNIGNDPTLDKVNWKDANIVRYVSNDLEMTVGAGGDFIRLDDALLYLGRFIPVDGARMTVKVLTTHLLDYPISINNVNLSGITIISEDGKFRMMVSINGLGSFYFFDTIGSLSFIGDFVITGTLAGSSNNVHPSIFFFEDSIVSILTNEIVVDLSNYQAGSTFAFGSADISVTTPNSPAVINLKKLAYFTVCKNISARKLVFFGDLHRDVFYMPGSGNSSLDEINTWNLNAPDAGYGCVNVQRANTCVISGPSTLSRAAGTSNVDSIKVKYGGIVSLYEVIATVDGSLCQAKNIVTGDGIILRK